MYARTKILNGFKGVQFIFFGVAFVVLLDGAIIPTWCDCLKLFYSSSKACRSIVGDAIRWRFFFCFVMHYC